MKLTGLIKTGVYGMVGYGINMQAQSFYTSAIQYMDIQVRNVSLSKIVHGLKLHPRERNFYVCIA